MSSVPTSSIARLARRLVACLALLLLPVMPATAMPNRVAISAGSFFAAATQCEKADLITPGQTAALTKALQPFLSTTDQTHMQSGFARGLKDSALYVIELKRWAPFAADPASCYRVQSVLDGYKAQLEE